MRSTASIIPLCLSLCLAAALCACGNGAAAPAESDAPSAAAAAGTSSAAGGFDIPGEELDALSVPQEGAQVLTDGLEGSYYNDFLRLTLTLDGSGGCALSGDGVNAGGRYSAEDGALTLDFGARRESAAIDADGDIRIEGRTGYFLRDWDFWHITEDAAGNAAVLSAAHTGTVDNGDGTYRYRDFEQGVAFTYPAGMTVLRDAVIGGVAVRDGNGGCVTGRNVTEIYSTHTGSDDEFLEDYVRSFVFADFAALYDGLGGYDALTLLHEGIEGRLAAATMQLEGKDTTQSVAAKIIFYTSTYADGTVNYICKTVFAPADGLDALASSVTGMGAVRLVAEG